MWGKNTILSKAGLCEVRLNPYEVRIKLTSVSFYCGPHSPLCVGNKSINFTSTLFFLLSNLISHGKIAMQWVTKVKFFTSWYEGHKNCLKAHILLEFCEYSLVTFISDLKIWSPNETSSHQMLWYQLIRSNSQKLFQSLMCVLLAHSSQHSDWDGRRHSFNAHIWKMGKVIVW